MDWPERTSFVQQISKSPRPKISFPKTSMHLNSAVFIFFRPLELTQEASCDALRPRRKCKEKEGCKRRDIYLYNQRHMYMRRLNGQFAVFFKTNPNKHNQQRPVGISTDTITTDTSTITINSCTTPATLLNSTSTIHSSRIVHLQSTKASSIEEK